jgi:hypothetical protein
VARVSGGVRRRGGQVGDSGGVLGVSRGKEVDDEVRGVTASSNA